MAEKTKISQYDKLTKTPIPKLIIQLAIPTVLSMLVTNVYNLADTAFVGRLGTSASGAVGVVFGYMSIIQAVGFMFGQGSGSIISRLLGAKKDKEATTTASTAFFCAIAAGLILEILGFVFRRPLVMLLGSTETIAPYAETYITYILLAAPFMTASFVLNNILRYEGKASMAMIGLMTGGILNIGMDPLFMFVFGMGIAGAGLATGLSQCISFSILLYMFLSGKTQSKISIREVDARPGFIGNICTTGLPSMLRQGLTSMATVLLNGQAAVYGDASVAALSIVSRIMFFVMSVGLGIGQGFQPVSAFNYGAKRFSRVRSAYRFTFALAQTVVAIGAIAVFIFSGSLIGVFRNDPQVIEIGTRALRLQCATILFMPFCMITEMLFQSTGKKLGASILSSLRSGAFFIPAVLILPRLRGLSGVQEAQPVAYVLAFIPAVFFAIWFFRNLPKDDPVS